MTHEFKAQNGRIRIPCLKEIITNISTAAEPKKTVSKDGYQYIQFYIMYIQASQ